jgi:hypothetical protein
MADSAGNSAVNVEALLKSALRPIDPPEKLSTRMEDTLSSITDAAAQELSAWADELEESELRSLRDPRNWVRPVAAVASGTLAGGALVVLGLRNRGKGKAPEPGVLEGAVKDLRRRFER